MTAKEFTLLDYVTEIKSQLTVRSPVATSSSDLISLAEVAKLLGINRNKVNRIPVQHRLIQKRKTYQRGDVVKWANFDLQQPSGILASLREEQAAVEWKNLSQPSRRYQSGNLSPEEAKEAKEKTKLNLVKPYSADEQTSKWTGQRRKRPTRHATFSGWGLIREKTDSA